MRGDLRENLNVDYNMKLYINEQLHKIAYLETTNIKPPSESVKTKGAHKKVKRISNDNFTKQPPSYFEHVNSMYSYFPPSLSKKSSMKGVVLYLGSLRLWRPRPEDNPPKRNLRDLPRERGCRSHARESSRWLWKNRRLITPSNWGMVNTTSGE